MEDETTVPQHGMNRRTLIKSAGVGAGALALGGALVLKETQSSAHVEAASTFIKGADVSWLPQMEALGYKFYNASGVQQDLFTILKGYGINAIRLRTFVNPSNSPQNGHCSQKETIAMAVRCKNAGLLVDIDFMFGDTWNSVGSQNPPAAWAKMSYSQMLTAMKNYVSGFMTAMKASNVTPTWVQIGNEENSGICHPVGAVNSHPDQMTGLLMNAYNAIKATFPTTQVIIHLAQPQKLASFENFLDKYKQYGGKWDVTGFSSYASGGNIQTVLTNAKVIQQKYGKPIMQVEVGGQVSQPASTRSKVAAFVKGMKSIGGLGVFYWEPEGYSPFTDYTMVAWDSKTKRPTAALNGFLDA